MKIKSVPFVGAILGKLYLAVVFIEGTIRQYWLQEPATWKPDTVYQPGQLVQPSVPDGYYYAAETPAPAQIWQPNTKYNIGDKVQPTTPNGYYYEVTDATGDAMSGATEPVWPTVEGSVTFESDDASTVPSATPTAPTANTQVDPAIQQRYDLLSGVKGVSDQ